MRKRSGQHRHLGLRQGSSHGFFAHAAHFFRERQIYVRSKGEVQFVTIKPYMMVIGLVFLMAGFFWIAFASINVTFKDELIAVRERNLYKARLEHEERISSLQKTIDRMNEKLLLDQDGYLQEVDKLRGEYGKLVGQHQRLTEFFQQGWMPQKKQSGSLSPKNKKGTTSDKQSPNPFRPGKGSFLHTPPSKSAHGLPTIGHTPLSYKYAKAFTSRRQALAPLDDVRNELKLFAPLQEKLLDDVIALAKAETKKIEKIYTSLGIQPDTVLKSAKIINPDSMGGPFVAPNADDLLDQGVAKRMKKAALLLSRAELLQDQASQLPLAMPVHHISSFSSRFGLRRDPLRRVAAMHTGIDIKAPLAANVLATANGIVAKSGWTGGYGRLVEVRHKNGVSTRYAHLKKILVKNGQHVKLGDVVGLLGNSGRSTGAHLHYETRLGGRAMNPTRFWKARHDFQALAK